AFTFDDGPFIYTETVKSILKKYNIKATFFVNGYNWGNITDFVATLQDSVAQGYQIGLHGWSHCDFTDHVNCPYNTEVDRLAEVVKGIIGVYPTYFRFPYGSYDDNAQQYMASKGYRIVGWNIDTNDWQEANKADPNLSFQNIQAALNVTSPATFSAISLSHDVHNTTGATPNSYLEHAIQYVLAQGYTPVTVAECDNDPSGGFRQ
ncbi:carbohydrate esterase family 4 protein, partial [Gonapodya prolifera JEL478]